MFRVCVVGSGPGGLYTAKYLLKSSLSLKLDVVDKLPTCYGLVRYGVAPDHPEVKSVSNDFDEVMQDERVRFFGNVSVGKHVSVDQLLSAYDGVVLAYGASSDRLLGIDGETDTSNVWGARDFVNWYNGHPEMQDRAPPLLDCESAAIVGNGNVALDCARILTKSVDELASTDISSTALEMLSQSKIRKVSVLGRRGSPQGAFTIKEMRELTKLSGVGCLIHREELDKSFTPASLEEIKNTRPTKRINDLLEKTCAEFDAVKSRDRIVDMRFLVSPTAIHRDASGRVSGLTLQRNKLEGPAFKQSAVPIEGDFEEIDCGLLIRSIGYRSEPLPGVPFDTKKNVVDHQAGRVTGVPGLYTSGWVKRGPTGIIGTNITDAKETVDSIVHDLSKATPKSHRDLSEMLGVECKPIDWQGYRKIEQEEFKLGSEKQPAKPRDKILRVDDMLKIATQ